MKNLDYNFIKDTNEYYLIGIVSSCKEYKLAWLINTSFDIRLKKMNDEKIQLINNKSVDMSYLIYRNKKKYLRLISNKLNGNQCKSHFISSLSDFDYLIQFSKNIFDGDLEDIINRLKSNNLIQFANFVDIKLVREKYLLYI